MRRIRRTGIALVAATALPGAVAAQAPARAATGAPPRAALRGLVCQRALDPPARAVDVTTVMRPIAGTARMAVQFTLLVRAAGAASFTPIVAPGLGTWLTPSDPTLGQRPGDVWIVKHPVADLNAPALYRFQVVFRWTDAKGRVLGTSVRNSRVCTQPELRPDLVVSAVSVLADQTDPALDDYLVTLANSGATAAGPFTLRLTDGGVVKDKVVDHLAPRSSKSFQFVGPACDSTAPPTVTADPAGQVDVSSRAGATLAVTCPAA